MRRSLQHRALAVAAILAWGCRDPTQIKVELTTDADCGLVEGTTLTTGRLESLATSPPSLETSTCEQQRIGSVVLVPSGENDGRVALRVVTGVEKSPDDCIRDDFVGGCIVAWRSLRYVPHSSLVLPIAMKLDCLDVLCEEGATCLGGECVSAEVQDPESACSGGDCLPGTSTLPPGDPNPVCGNAVIEIGEDCDDGNDVTESCAPEPCEVCQQGCLLGPGGPASSLPSAEVCDDGQDNDNNGFTDDADICGCKAGSDNCSNVCFDLLTTPVHCGTCDIACAADEVCEGGVCVTECQDETIGGRDYSFCLGPLAWADAATACEAKGMQLVGIDDPLEDAAVLASSQAVFGEEPSSWPWIGANELDVAGEWRWPDGSGLWLGGANGEPFFNSLTCAESTDCPSGTCSPTSGTCVGGACSSDGECASGHCSAEGCGIGSSAYVNWAVGEPAVAEQCAVLQTGPTPGPWSAAACDGVPRPYVCELN